MTISRRHICKMLAAAPAIAWASRQNLLALPLSPCGCINIVLHGLFFMEFHGKVLLAATPDVQGHPLFFRDHGAQLQPLNGVVDLSGLLKASSPVTAFPPDSLLFSKKDIGASGDFIDRANPQKYKCLLVLPAPNRVLPLRSAPFNTFSPFPGKVADSILAHHHNSSVVPVITCLQYDRTQNGPFDTRNFYAEHDHQPTLTEVNNTLLEATTPFASFDLQMQFLPDAVNCVDTLPDELDRGDESSLEAIKNQGPCFSPPTASPDGHKLTTEVASCPQFGVIP